MSATVPIAPPSLASLAPGRQRHRMWGQVACLLGFVLADVLAFFIAAQIAQQYVLQHGAMALADTLHPGQLMRKNIFLLLLTGWLLWFHVVKLSHRQRRPFWTDLQKLLFGILALAVADLALLAIAGIDLAHTWWASVWLLLLALMPLARLLARKLLSAGHLWHRPTVIIGTGDNAVQAYRALLSEPTMGIQVVAFACPGAAQPVSPLPSLPCLRWPGQGATANELRPFHYVIALEAGQWPERDAVIRQLTHCGVDDLQVIPAMRGVPLYGLDTSHFLSHEVLLIDVRNNLASPIHRLTKRVFDIVGSAVLLALLSPLFALLAYKVSRDGGPAFFGHTRIGRNGKPFKCYKFRSMIVNAQAVLAHLLATDPQAKAEWDQDFKLKDDPRVSTLGHLLRRTSLDELPQLWNVLKGDMSLVGPRPIVQAELERYGDDVDFYLMARPGMTGLWQVSGRNDVDYATRVYFDSWYVKNWALWTDIAILFKTVGVVTGRNGAY